MPPEEFAAQCWRLYSPYIKKLLRYKLASMPEEIDDCLSETFLALLSALKRGEEIEKPKAWLTVTANNIVKKEYDARRKENERREPDSESILFTLPAPEEADDNEPTEESILAAKDDFLSSLTPAERELFDLRFLQRKKLKNIAFLTGVTENNVKQRIFRLKRKAETFVKKWGQS